MVQLGCGRAVDAWGATVRRYRFVRVIQVPVFEYRL